MPVRQPTSSPDARLTRRFVIGTAAAGLLMGCYWGHYTVAGVDMRADPAGAFAHRDVVPDANAAPAGAQPRIAEPAVLALSAEGGCASSCSEFDLGRRWARTTDVSHAGQCDDPSWSFRRGCLAYLRDGRISENRRKTT